MLISKWFLVPLLLAILTVGVVNIYRGSECLYYDVSCIITGIIGLGAIVGIGYMEKRNANKIKV